MVVTLCHNEECLKRPNPETSLIPGGWLTGACGTVILSQMKEEADDCFIHFLTALPRATWKECSMHTITIRQATQGRAGDYTIGLVRTDKKNGPNGMHYGIAILAIHDTTGKTVDRKELVAKGADIMLPGLSAKVREVNISKGGDERSSIEIEINDEVTR
jgi:hypothetical protein